MNGSDQPLVNRAVAGIAIGETASSVRFVRTDGIGLFAAMSGDVNPAHLDERFAGTDIFGHVVIHGMWTAALFRNAASRRGGRSISGRKSAFAFCEDLQTGLVNRSAEGFAMADRPCATWTRFSTATMPASASSSI